MPRSNWRYVFAAVGLLVFLSISYASYQLYQASEQRRSEYGYQPARHARVGVIMPAKAKAKEYQPTCGNPQTNGNADLCAQWAAVDQVMESNRLASVNVRLSLFVAVLTLLGTVFVGWTLLQTRNIARRELRAYLAVDQIRFDKGGIWFRLRNHGQTPAFNVNLVTRYHQDGVVSPCVKHGFGIADPGEADGLITMTAAEVAAGKIADNASIEVKIVYDDCFGVKWEREGWYLRSAFGSKIDDQCFHILDGTARESRAKN